VTLDIQLVGNAMQMAVCRLQPGQVAFCEAGKFLFCSNDIEIETKLSEPSAPAGQSQQAGGRQGGGGFGGLLRGAMDAGRRMVAGESFAFQHFHTSGGDGLVAFAGTLPGEMQVLELAAGNTWYTEKDAFIAAEAGVHFDISFAGWRSGMSGGEGFILEKFTGTGSLLIGGAGNFIEINPAEYGGRLRVDTGCIVAFDQNIRYGIERVGRFNRQGVTNMMFGGEGMSLATLEGNGRVILQSMTIQALAQALEKNAGAGDKTTGSGLGGIFTGSSD
jgi:uncharacterized protein (AIM24 family)